MTDDVVKVGVRLLMELGERNAQLQARTEAQEAELDRLRQAFAAVAKARGLPSAPAEDEEQYRRWVEVTQQELTKEKPNSGAGKARTPGAGSRRVGRAPPVTRKKRDPDAMEEG